MPAAAQGGLVKESSIQRQLQRERRRHMQGIPKTASEIDLSSMWGETHKREYWVMCDIVCENEQRLIIFSTMKLCLNWLSPIASTET
jgi:hypothetical protein